MTQNQVDANIQLKNANFAPSSKGVTNGDTHDHVGGDGADITKVPSLNVGTQTGAPTGAIYMSGNQLRGSTTNLNFRMRTFVVANNAVAQLLDTADPFAFCIIMSTEGAGAFYECRGGIHGTAEVADWASIYSPTAGTASSNNVYWSAGNARYELENKRGSTFTYYVFYFADA